MKAATAVYGYMEQKLLAGKALYTEAASLQNTQIKEYADQVAALSQFGYTAEKLQQESELVSEVSKQYHQQLLEIGEAQKATQARDKKIDELSKWISDFRAVAKVALADDPQQLEKLGILARTSRASKSKNTADGSQTDKQN